MSDAASVLRTIHEPHLRVRPPRRVPHPEGFLVTRVEDLDAVDSQQIVRDVREARLALACEASLRERCSADDLVDSKQSGAGESRDRAVGLADQPNEHIVVRRSLRRKLEPRPIRGLASVAVENPEDWAGGDEDPVRLIQFEGGGVVSAIWLQDSIRKSALTRDTLGGFCLVAIVEADDVAAIRLRRGDRPDPARQSHARADALREDYGKTDDEKQSPHFLAPFDVLDWELVSRTYKQGT